MGVGLVMEAVVAAGGGNAGVCGGWKRNPHRSGSQRACSSVTVRAAGGFVFPLKQASVAASLVLTGDTIAQVSDRLKKRKKRSSETFSDREKLSGPESVDDSDEGLLSVILREHDWLRALRMVSYGFLLYGPGSYAWYQFLDRCLPKQNVRNLMLKVLLNQIVLGPCVIAIVFAWNNLWLGKLSQLLEKYRRDALPTLLYGLRFWIPVSLLNFWVVPLQVQVAFMSMGSIFWNFYLSSTMNK